MYYTQDGMGGIRKTIAAEIETQTLLDYSNLPLQKI